MINIIIGCVLGLAIGFAIAKIMEKNNASQILNKAKNEAEISIKNANKEVELALKNSKMDTDLALKNAKIEADKIVNKANQYYNDKKNDITQKLNDLNGRKIEITNKEKEIKSVENKLNEQIASNEALKNNLEKKIENINNRENELKVLEKKNLDQLEMVSQMTTQEAKSVLMDQIREEAKANAASFVHNTIQEAKLNATEQARRIVIDSIQRIGVEEAIENCVSVFPIDDMKKGSVIGREGRNIRALSAETGVEITVDDTPGSITLSCFDGIRREVCYRSLSKLVEKGNIHPGIIEEVVAKTAKQVEDDIIETGKRIVIELGITGMAPELVKYVGRMKYRSSYGQNLLRHSCEVAKLCGVMAAELGMDVKLAKRAGLLHDIGKVPETETDLPHAILSMELAQKYGEVPEVCNAIGAHHNEIEMTYLLSPLVQVCDGISGAKPGARNQNAEEYLKRLKDLETIANEFEGVQKSFVIQGGRDLRVIVDSEKISDEKAAMISLDISKRIEKEMKYPGQIKVNVIRETRAISVAK